MDQCILAYGDLSDGYTFVGPFPDSEAAREYGESEKGRWEIHPLDLPDNVTVSDADTNPDPSLADLWATQVTLHPHSILLTQQQVAGLGVSAMTNRDDRSRVRVLSILHALSAYPNGIWYLTHPSKGWLGYRYGPEVHQHLNSITERGDAQIQNGQLVLRALT